MIRGIFWGLVVAWIGIWIWLGSTVAPGTFAFRYSWPIIFVILGLMGIVELIQRAIRKTRYGTRLGRVGWKLFWGLLLIAIGLVVWFSNIGLIVPGFGTLWPFIIVAVGVAIMLKTIIKKSHRPRGVNVIIDKLEDGKIDVDEAVDEIRRTRNTRKGHHCHE